MSDDTCILTPKDFTILEVMRDRYLGRDDPLAPLLRRKLESARVVFRDDVPASVATLNSRVSFRPGGGDPDTRILSNERMASPVGLSLSIATPRGLALLGLAEGEAFRLAGRDGSEEWIMLEKVRYQPEAARRDKELARGQASPARGKPVLRLIRGASVDRQAPAPVVYDTFDDPGPSAA